MTHAAALAALLALVSLALPSPALAQMSDDPEMRVQQLENQLRQLTGQNEELQYRNRQLEDRLKMLQGSAPPAPGQPQPNIAAAPPAQQYPPPGQAYPPAAQPYPPARPPAYEPQIAAPGPIVQEPAVPGRRTRGDAFDPSQNPNAPGAPRALGGGPGPVAGEAPVGGRAAGEPLNLENPNAAPGGDASPPRGPAYATLPPSATPKDEFDLGIGYMQHRDYELAERTMRDFGQKFPTDPLLADSQYWLGESFFQRQRFRDAAESFLAVTTKFEKSAKAPDAMLRLGQSLAALKEKEAACAALGEVIRKYPRASSGVKAAVDREQKRAKC
jgi:tol-pal system protein YbgF